jgi:hypothetical protein
MEVHFEDISVIEVPAGEGSVQRHYAAAAEEIQEGAAPARDFADDPPAKVRFSAVGFGQRPQQPGGSIAGLLLGGTNRPGIAKRSNPLRYALWIPPTGLPKGDWGIGRPGSRPSGRSSLCVRPVAIGEAGCGSMTRHDRPHGSGTKESTGAMDSPPT